MELIDNPEVLAAEIKQLLGNPIVLQQVSRATPACTEEQRLIYNRSS